MESPELPPVVAGRSALPAFLAVETWAESQLSSARASAAETLREAQAKAAQIRAQGEAALQDAVLDGERAALRIAEDRARDRISEARMRLQAWIDASEAEAQAILTETLQRFSGGA